MKSKSAQIWEKLVCYPSIAPSTLKVCVLPIYILCLGICFIFLFAKRIITVHFILICLALLLLIEVLETAQQKYSLRWKFKSSNAINHSSLAHNTSILKSHKII